MGACRFESACGNNPTHRARPVIPAQNGTAPLSGGRLSEETPRVPHERIQGAEEEHCPEHGPQSRGAGAVFTDGNNEQRHADTDAEDRDQSADAMSHKPIINDNLGQRK